MKLKIQELLKKYNVKIDNIAQFGAHSGQEIEIFLNIANNNIYLFEPQKNAFNQLINKTHKHKKISIYNFGLGSTNTKKSLFVDYENDGQSASIYEPKIHLDIFPEISFKKREEIKIITFDSLELKVDLICIDIQGAELDALIGSHNSLQFTKCLVIEVSREEFYKNQPSIKEIDNFLNKNNFMRVKTKWAESGKFLYGDAFYIKRDIISNYEILLNNFKNIILDRRFVAVIKYFFSRVKFRLKI